MTFKYHDGQMERTVGHWPADVPMDGEFKTFASICRVAAESVSSYHKARAEKRAVPTPAELREAETRGKGAIETLYAAKQAVLAEEFAMAQLGEIAKLERRLAGLQAQDLGKVAELATRAPLNDVTVHIAMELVRDFRARDGAGRVALIERAKSGQLPQLAAALLDIPEPLRPTLDNETLQSLHEGIATAKDPQQMAAIRARRELAPYVTGTLRNSADALRAHAKLPDSVMRGALGESYSRLYPPAK